MINVEIIINKCKKNLDTYFCNHPFIVWKEEDLQSYFFHLLLEQDQSLYSRIHREFPVITQWEPRRWAGMLDIAILGIIKDDFNLRNAKIDYAIELKFIRDYRTGKSSSSLQSFKNECIKDRNKLLSNAKNFHDNTKKYFWAFRYIDEPQNEKAYELMNGIEWDDVIWKYTEFHPI